MKNKVLLAILAIALVFGMTACSGGGDGDDTNKDDTSGDSTISGSTIVSGAKVVYPYEYITNMADAKKRTDFSYHFEYDEKTNKDKVSPLSKFLSGESNVKINDEKITIKLGTPKDGYLEYMSDIGWPFEGLTITPNNAKIFDMLFEAGMITSDGKYGVGCFKDQSIIYDNDLTVLIYVDIDATISGTTTADSYGVKYIFDDVSLKKGWNFLIWSDVEKNTSIVTSSLSQPSGYTWTVIECELVG